MNDRKKLVENTKRDVERLEQHERKPPTLIGIVFYGGTLGLLMAVPIVLGAYLGRWLDTLASGYSVRWTVSMILLGIGIGIWNVVRFIKDKL